MIFYQTKPTQIYQIKTAPLEPKLQNQTKLLLSIKPNLTYQAKPKSMHLPYQGNKINESKSYS